MKQDKAHPLTPDGRYFIVRGRLWRCKNPQLSDVQFEQYTAQLTNARQNLLKAKKQEDLAGITQSLDDISNTQEALGERGKVWWSDGAPDYNRHMVRTTPYAA